MTCAGDASGYLECANESDEAPCGWHVAPDAVGLLPYAGQKGYVAAWDGGGAVGVVANYKPGFDDEIMMGHLEAFREVRVLGNNQEFTQEVIHAMVGFWWWMLTQANLQRNPFQNEMCGGQIAWTLQW